MKLFLSLLVLLVFALNTSAQPFAKEINHFRQLDSASAPPADPILFIGSSSFTNWKDVKDYFPSYPILNRGFGGSTLLHQIMYADEVIFKYHPKQIVIYCGENDFISPENITGDSVLQRFKRLYNLIRNRLPAVPIVYISIKPSPSREKYLPVMKEANRLIEAFTGKEKNIVFVDVFHKMFTEDGQIMSDIFLADQLHMNKKGYAIWQPVIAPHLVR